MAGKTVLILVLANSIFHMRDILPIFEAEFIESVVQASFATCFLFRSAFKMFLYIIFYITKLPLLSLFHHFLYY